jgi:hypothetical protein
MPPRLVLFALATFALPLSAQAQNILIPVQGLLTDTDDRPIEGSKDLEFGLISQSGEPVWSNSVTVTLVGGLFSVYLGQELDLSADLFGPEGAVSLNLSIDGDSVGAWPIGAVPYAAQAHRANQAKNADSLGGQAADAFAAADHHHALGAGAGLAVDDDGNLALAPGGVTASNLGDAGCAEGQLLQWSGNAWVCGDDVDTDTNTQLSEEQVDAFVDNNDYVVGPAQACAVGQLLKVTDNGWACADDADADTQLSEEQVDGFVANNNFVVGPAQPCVAGQVLKANDNGWTCASDADTDTQLSEEQVDGFVANNNFVVGPAQPCAAGQVLKANDNGWTCASDADADTTYTAGSGLSLSVGNQFYIGGSAIDQTHLSSDSVRASELADNSVDLAAMRDNSVGAAEIVNDSISQLELADNSVGNEEMQNNAINTAELANGAVTRGKLNQSGCSSGQILKFANAGWVCAADDNSQNTYTAGSGLALSGNTFRVPTGAINAGHLATNSVGESEVADNAVGYAEMQNDAIGNEEMRSNAIGLTEMQDDSVGYAEMRDNSIGQAEMRDNSVGSAEIRTDAVGSLELVNGGVGTADLADGSVTNAKIPDGAAIAGHKIVYHDEVYVPGNLNQATQNGAALIAAFENINANTTNRKVLRIGPGDFDLGTASLIMDYGLTVIGAGVQATHIYSRPTGASASTSSFVIRGRKHSALRHLKVTNKDAADNSSTATIRMMETADQYAGEAFMLSHVHVSIEGVSDAYNTAILNQGSMMISDTMILNKSGGSGVSNGIYSTNASTYTRVSDSLIKVYNASGASVKHSIFAAGGTFVEIYNTRIIQSTVNAGDGIALYANGNNTWIYAYGSAVFGKTDSAKEVGGNVTFFGGRMSDNEGSGVTCMGMRSWIDNNELNGNCD